MTTPATSPPLAATLKKIPPSDYKAIHLLEKGMTEPVLVRELYAAGRASVRVPADGYAFPWGLVVESLSGLLVVLDFHLEYLQAEFDAKGHTATTMQERLFSLVEDITDHARRESLAAWNPLAPGQYGWVLVPGTLGKAAAFTALCHINEEHAFREWLIADILVALSGLIQRLYDEL